MRHLLLLALALTACKPEPGDDPIDGGVDADGDGFVAAVDCDDTNPAIAPFAPEICDGIDQNCDLVVDDGAGAVTWYPDADGDGFGDTDKGYNACTPNTGDIDKAGDCDDGDKSYNPEAEEACGETRDLNCDGSLPTEDADKDGYASCEECDDSNPDINPAALEACNEIDDDCDTIVDEDVVVRDWYLDADNDGYGDPDAATVSACAPPDGYVGNDKDCEDDQVTINPAAEERCDGADNDCDTLTDDATAADASTWYLDADHDEFGDPAETTVACDQPADHVADDTDCDDTKSAFNPDATERCDGYDEDCNGVVDDDAVDASIWYLDDDDDGHGATSSVYACSQPAGYAATNDDCDDARADVSPSDDEVCDDVDNDCDAEIDEAGAVDGAPSWPDGDGDTYGDAGAKATNLCGTVAGFVTNADDCDDDAVLVNPGATETCNDIDDDCDTVIDPSTSTGASTWYADDDGDTYGAVATSAVACDKPSGYVSDKTDCDDGDPADHPGATEICDLDDDDCDGTIDEDVTKYYLDADGDTYGAGSYACTTSGRVSNNSDCNDASKYVYPGAAEICDGIQNDCSDTAWTDSKEDGLVSEESTAGAWSNISFSGASAPKSYAVPKSGTVWFCRGTYSVGMTADTPDTALIGRHGAASTTITGAGSKRVLEVTGKAATLTITDLTLTDGYAGSTGGAGIYFDTEATLTLDGLLFDDNNTTGPGGAIYFAGGTLTAIDTEFTDNTASSTSTGRGGAIYAATSSTVSLSGCTFTTNDAGLYGGGLYATSSTVDVADTTFDTNKSAYGAGVFLSGGTLDASDSGFYTNEATTGGGALLVNGTTTTLSGATFSSNKASGGSGWGGGGIDVEGGSVVAVTGSIFTSNNAAGNDGGAMLVADGTVTLTESELNSNAAFDEGGGISTTDGNTVALVGTTLTSNSAKTGAGIDMDGGTVTCGDSSAIDGGITSNAASATNGGGGLHISDGAFTSTSCDFGDDTSTNNTPADIRAGSNVNYGNDATFGCTSSGCL